MDDLPMNVAIDTDKKELKVIYAVRQVEVGFLVLVIQRARTLIA